MRIALSSAMVPSSVALEAHPTLTQEKRPGKALGKRGLSLFLASVFLARKKEGHSKVPFSRPSPPET